jgi:hypothetical protein
MKMPFDPVDSLLDNFDFYIRYFQYRVVPTWHAPVLHRQTLDLRRAALSAVDAVQNPQFMASLRDALHNEFRLQRHPLNAPLVVNAALHNQLRTLDGVRLENATQNELDLLWNLLVNLDLRAQHAKLVVNSKALAHVLTELVVPIDREYTAAFLFRFAREFDDDPHGQGHPHERSVFDAAFRAFQRIARAIDLAPYVSNNPHNWNTTRPKVIDNAIVGFVEYARFTVNP